MALTEMTPTIDYDRSTIDFDSIHEYLRDAHLPSREAAVSMSSSVFSAFNQRQIKEEVVSPPEAPETDELEALWPGVHHDFPHQQLPRGSSFYLSVGFAAGALISIIGIFGFFSVSHLVTAKAGGGDKVQVAAGTTAVTGPLTSNTASGDVLVPAAPQYQVQPGDTLAVIAMHNYKRVSPRLLDEICRANNMRNANVLSLGQKLVLPEYRPSGQIAATTSVSVQ